MLTMYRPLHYLIVCYSLHACVRSHTRASICVRWSFLLSCFRCHFWLLLFFVLYACECKLVFKVAVIIIHNTHYIIAADKLKWHYNLVFFICVLFSFLVCSFFGSLLILHFYSAVHWFAGSFSLIYKGLGQMSSFKINRPNAKCYVSVCTGITLNIEWVL